jgi:hypothetical protein
MMVQNAGADALFIHIQVDEAMAMNETSLWVFMLLSHCDKVSGMCMFADKLQIRAMAMSEHTGLNEFDKQRMKSFYERLDQSNFGVKVLLNGTGRYNAAIAEFLNLFVYEGKMQISAEARGWYMPAAFDKLLKDFVGETSRDIDMSVTVLGVQDGIKATDPESMSHYNQANINVGMALLIQNAFVKAADPKDMCIMTPWGRVEAPMELCHSTSPSEVPRADTGRLPSC